MPSHPAELHTRATLAIGLATLGLRRNDIVLIHSSLSSLGWVCGGATAVVQALLDVLGPAGTLVAPAHTASNRDPSRWTDPAIPESWWPTIREHLPGFDAELTPSHAVGVIAEHIRTWPGAFRSTHPQTSFAAIGRYAEFVTQNHSLESQLGEESPLARLEKVNARVLLLGVGYNRCTAFHLSEYRVPAPRLQTNWCAVQSPTGRHWISYEAVALDACDFSELGEDFERRTGAVTTGEIGAATCRLFSLPLATKFARNWFVTNRRRP